MSFGYGVGDIILVTQLAWKCVRNAREACGQYDELTREVGGLFSLLNQFQLEKNNQHYLLNQSNDDRKEEFNRIVENCGEILGELDAILKKYTALGYGNHSKGKKAWQKVKFGNDEMQDLIRLRQKMVQHTQNITAFCNLLCMGSRGRMEQHMRSSGRETRDIMLAINSQLNENHNSSSDICAA
jgi:hypothetical protein